MVEDMNRRSKTLCVEDKFSIIDNSSIDKPCLNHSRLHLNRKGIVYFAKNLLNFTNFIKNFVKGF